MFLILFLISFLLNSSASNKLPRDVIMIWKNVTNAYHKECLSISNANPNLINLMLERANVPDDVSLGCYLRCVYEKMGVLEYDGKFNLATIMNKCPYMTEEITVRCTTASKNVQDLCQKSLVTCNCTVIALRY
ncbi:hypothetical protein FQR65_LT00483 [Abscondita terminalis]|nr:hypothetical protein FQR65_LT00483 [Abscondita terminalis]